MAGRDKRRAFVRRVKQDIELLREQGNSLDEALATVAMRDQFKADPLKLRADYFSVVMAEGDWFDNTRVVSPYFDIPDLAQELKRRLQPAGAECRHHLPGVMSIAESLVKELLPFLSRMSKSGVSVEEMRWHMGQLGVKATGKEIGDALAKHHFESFVRKLSGVGSPGFCENSGKGARSGSGNGC